MSNYNQYDQIERSAVVLIGGEVFSFYANIEELETSPYFYEWSLSLVNKDFIVINEDVGTLEQDNITSTGYRFYSQFNIPSGLTEDCYYLVVQDGSGNVKYISNKLEYKNITDWTYNIRYRNSKNILNYNYNNIPGFYNRFRIKLVRRSPVNNTTSIGYDLVRGNFNPVRYVKGKTYTFITLWYDEFDHEAFNAITIHNNMEIQIRGQWVKYIRGESEYTIDWQANYPLAEGEIQLQQEDSYTSNKTL